jgi:hypothetical protein
MKYIVLVRIGEGNRTDLERIGGAIFPNIAEAKNSIGCECQIYDLSDFADLCNDEEIDLNCFWVGHIQLAS